MSRKWKHKAPQIRASKSPAQGRDAPKEFRIHAAGGPLTIRAADPAGENKLPSFEGNAYTGAPMRPDGWWGQIIVDLAGVKASSQHRPVLRQHDHQQIVGHTTSVKVTKDGVMVAGVLSGEQQHTDKVTVPARNGFQWQMSIGANPVRTEFLEAGEEATVNGRKVVGPMTISRETELGEISFVPLGADGDTSATIAAQKAAQKGKPMNPFAAALKELMAALKAKGKAAKYTDAEIDEMDADKCRAALKKAMKAADDDGDDDDADKKKADAKAATAATLATNAAAFQAQANDAMNSLRASAAAEHKRQSAIQAACREHGVTDAEIANPDGTKTRVNLAAHAIEKNWSAVETELAAIKAGRPGAGVGVPGGLGYSTSTPAVSDAVLEAAVFQASGQGFQLFDKEFYEKSDDGKRRVSSREEGRITGELKARYTEQVQQTAHTVFKGRLGLQQLLCSIAAQHGYRGRDSIHSFEEWGQVSQYLARGANQIEADGGSTVNIANVLANVQNKFMLQGYLFTEQAFMDIVSILPVKDFKPTKSIALFGDTEFQDVGANAEIPHGTLTDQPFANQASMRARMFTLPLQDIINDDLGMLGQVPMILGRGWGLKINRLVWSLLLVPGNGDDSVAFWRTTSSTAANAAYNPNKQTGAGSALNHAGLTAAKLLFDRQIDPVANPLGIDAEILLYPPELDVAAVELMNAQFIVMAGLASTAAASKQANTNIWKGRFKPVMSRYLSGSFTGNSTTGWYLLANPAVMPVIQISALNGQMVPTVQTAGQDFQFNILGISMRGFGGVGVGMQNFRGGVFSAGA